MLQSVKTKKITLDFFSLGLFFIPFDNLFLAPTTGWATIAPFFFITFILINFRLLGLALSKERNFFVLMVFLFVYQTILVIMNGIHINSFIDSLGTLILGISFFLALVIRYEVSNKNLMNKDGKILYIAYCVSFIYGIVRLLALKFYQPMLTVFEFIEKRSYDRLSFSFTEPSFISMHIIGVLFLFSYLVTDKKLTRKMIILGMSFFVVSILFGNSIRLLLDFAVLIFIYVMKKMLKDSKHLIRNIFLIIVGVVGALFIIESSMRLQYILERGIYADASLASRFFRINASYIGYLKEPFWALFGRGFGNLIEPLKLGYDEALLMYENLYMAEIVYLRDVQEIGSLFCLYIKLITEWGLVLTLFFLLYLFKRFLNKGLDVFVLFLIFWLYVQFDSYAFYSIWIILFLSHYYNSKKYGNTFLDFRLLKNS